MVGGAGSHMVLQACDRTTSGRGLLPGSTWAILGEARRQSTHICTIPYYKFRSYYNLGSCITKEVWCQKYASGGKSKFVEPISLNGQNIPFALKKNDIHQCSKPKDPSTESNPHRFGLTTNNPHRHCRKEEAVPHLHTENSKRKAWETTLSKTYPRWPKDHL
jgi:hypothetical protein